MKSREAADRLAYAVATFCERIDREWTGNPIPNTAALRETLAVYNVVAPNDDQRIQLLEKTLRESLPALKRARLKCSDCGTNDKTCMCEAVVRVERVLEQ